MRAVILTQYQRVTDRQTDGNAVPSAVLNCNASIAARCKNVTKLSVLNKWLHRNDMYYVRQIRPYIACVIEDNSNYRT